MNASAVTILKEFIAEGKHNRPGTKITPTSITIHNTDNPDKGAGAKAHSGFVRNTGYYKLKGSNKKHWVSWHFSVDDTFVIQHLPLDEVAYHAGATANATSIAIEICMNSDSDEATANLKAAGLVASLLQQLGLKVSDIKKHKDWTGKACPTRLLTTAKWNAFIALVQQSAPAPMGAPLAGLAGGEAAGASAARSKPPKVADFDIDHEELLEAVQYHAELPADHEHGDMLFGARADVSEIASALRGVIGSLTDGTMGADQPRLLFPYGINEIELSLSPQISVTVKGPDKAGSLAAGAETEPFDSVPEEDVLAAAGRAAAAAPPPVNVKLQVPTETLYGTHSEARRYGIQRTITAIEAVAEKFHQQTGLRVGVGEISKLGGGPIDGHASHQKGVDADIRLIRNDGAEQATKYQSATYSRQRTQLLVDLFRSNTVFPIKFIFFNDPHVSGVSPWPNHDNHLHVRFDIAQL